MDALFSCRNCIHNPAQTLSIGPGVGYCVLHRSVIWDSTDTTCKYLQRKDLPRFLVDEGIREHAAEFSGFSGMARLSSPETISRIQYSEKFVWERRQFNPVVHALTLMEKAERTWVSIQTFAAGGDGRRSIAYGSLLRRYLSNCDNWVSSYRLILGFLQEIDVEPHFSESDLLVPDGNCKEAGWDVVFNRLATVQEFGWHAALDDLRWATDCLNGALVDFDWNQTLTSLSRLKAEWTEQVIALANREGVFFPSVEPDGAAAE